MRHRVFVPLQKDPKELRELEAVPFGDGRFRLVGNTAILDPLLFSRGDIVECEIQSLPNGSKGLVAVHSISADPEFRKRRVIYAVLGFAGGAFFGGWLGLMTFLSLKSASIGAVIGAIVFSFSSVRWGDSAWRLLGRSFWWS